MTTDRFRLDTGAYFIRLVYMHGTAPIATVVVLFLVAVALAFAIDLHFAIVAVMVALLIFPFAMAWLYFSRGLHPGYSFNVAWHTLRVDKDRIEITLYRPVYEEVTDEESETVTEKLTGWEEGKKLSYDGSSLCPFLSGGDGITIPLKSNKGMIAIPRIAFSSPEKFNEFISLCKKIIENDSRQQ